MAARTKTSKKSSDGKKPGKKKTKKTSSESAKSSPDKAQEKKDRKEQAKIRNGKAKNAGARLGGFLRSSLSFHRSRSSKSLSDAVKVDGNEKEKEAPLVLDDNSTKTSRSTRSHRSTKSSKNGDNVEDCLNKSNRSIVSNLSGSTTGRSRRSSGRHDQGDENLHLSIRSISSKRSDKSQRSMLSLDDGDIEWSDYGSDSSEEIKPEPSKAHLKAREKLLLESQQAIQRRQQYAKMRSQSMDMVSMNTSKRASTSLSPHVGNKPKFSKESRSISVTPSLSPHVGDKPKFSKESRSMSMGVFLHSATQSVDQRKVASRKERYPGSPNRRSVQKLPSAEGRPRSHSECEARSNRPRALSFDKTKSTSEQGKPSNQSEPRRGVIRSRSDSEKKVKSKSRSPSEKRSVLRTRSMSQEKRSLSKIPSMRKLFKSSNKTDPNNAADWHSAIVRHEWDAVEALLKSYNYAAYTAGGKSSKKSPLLEVDSNGRTALHLSCVEHMPQKLLLKLLFVERKAAGVKDKDGRFALHLALINNLENEVLDRLIRGHPKSLGTPDHLKKTPIQYAILKADYQRTTSFPDVGTDSTWNSPTTRDHKYWQEQQRRAWTSVSFIVETMVTRRKALSPVHERTVLLESFQLRAPPEVVKNLITVGGKALLDDAEMSKELVETIFDAQYPVSVTKRILKVTSKVLPKVFILDAIRNGLNDHFQRGLSNLPREETRERSFVAELLQQYRSKASGSLTLACQEWWDKLRFLIAYASCRFNDDTDDIVLHAALTNPSSPPSLIEFLCRLLPTARYEIDVASGGLPLHLACMYWHPNVSGQDALEYTRVLNLLMAGDVCLVQSRCKRRLSLHHALLTKKPTPFIQTLLTLDPKTVVAPDPVTRLFPFQLAALPSPRIQYGSAETTSSSKSGDLEQISLVYDLLRSNPFPMSILSGCQVEDMSPLTRHIIRWSYDWDLSGWQLNQDRTNLLRVAIRRGKVFGELKSWWSMLKTLIWRAANEEVDENGQNPMCNTPQNRDYLLHAALWNCRQIPPIVIELIAEVYPASVFTKQPGTDLYPLQIAARSHSYRPFAFENVISMSSALEMLSLLDEDAVRIHSTDGKIPLHDAISSRKPWSELRPLIEKAPKSPLKKDPSTGFFAYQTAACIDSFIPRHEILKVGRSDTQWAEASPEENARTIKDICNRYECEKLGTIFELLRAAPTALELPNK
ncbi:MAG: hypothetical protein SGILL_002829 [Bacillariaceae sp.]